LQHVVLFWLVQGAVQSANITQSSLERAFYAYFFKKIKIDLLNFKWVLFERQPTYLWHTVLFLPIQGAVDGAKVT